MGVHCSSPMYIQSNLREEGKGHEWSDTMQAHPVEKHALGAQGRSSLDSRPNFRFYIRSSEN